MPECVNDKTYGGVFVSDDGGAQWKHIGPRARRPRRVVLAQAGDGTVLAGTNSGIFALDSGLFHVAAEKHHRQHHCQACRRGGSRKARHGGEKREGSIGELGSTCSRSISRAMHGWPRRPEGSTPAKTKARPGKEVPRWGRSIIFRWRRMARRWSRRGPTARWCRTTPGRRWWPVGIPTVFTRIQSVAFSGGWDALGRSARGGLLYPR